MLFAIDAGNTNTTFAVLTEQGDICHKWRIQNDPLRTEDEYAGIFLPLMAKTSLKDSDFKLFLLCSVVPNVNQALKNFILKYFKKTLRVVGEPGVEIPVTSLVDRPEAVGDDRLMNFVGANRRFQEPLLVVDFGTATTFDFIDENGNHLGGCIAPGACVTANALSEAGALLPKLPLTKPEKVIGTWTIPQMQSGVFWGYVGLFEGLIQRLLQEFMVTRGLTKKPRVIATGGLSSLFKDVTDVFDGIFPDLILEGLFHVYKNGIHTTKE